MLNLLLQSDAYKASHWRGYPPGSTHLYSYLESRGGKHPHTVFAGLQYILRKYLTGQVVTRDGIDEAAQVIGSTFRSDTVFNREGWEHIRIHWNGNLPLLIRAVPEGTLVPTNNVLMTIENLDGHVPWLTNYVEGLLMKVWSPTTVATESFEAKRLLLRALDQSGSPELIPFMLHDMGYRGVSSEETSQIAGFAHLINFQGTDTLPALRLARKYYNEPNAGYTIPASEHSTTTSWARSGEAEAYEAMLDAYPTLPVSLVADSYDVYRACRELFGSRLREKILMRTVPVIIRLDSGDPVVVLQRCTEILAERFGFTVNTKGYRVLHPNIRLLQADGMNLSSLALVVQALMDKGWSIDNYVFGMGGALLQKNDRDTQKFAIKASEIVVAGQSRPVYKDPLTDPGKRSKSGRLKLVLNDNGLLVTIPEDGADKTNLLRPVFFCGDMQVIYRLDSIRKRAEDSLEALRRNAA